MRTARVVYAASVVRKDGNARDASRVGSVASPACGSYQNAVNVSSNCRAVERIHVEMPVRGSRGIRIRRVLPSDCLTEPGELHGGVALVESDSVQYPCGRRIFRNRHRMVADGMGRIEFNPSRDGASPSVDSEVRGIVHPVGGVGSSRGIRPRKLSRRSRASAVRESVAVLFRQVVHRVIPDEVRVGIERSVRKAF